MTASARALDRTFHALSDKVRRDVVLLLGDEPRRASELADALALPRPAMSKHLKVLREAGLVEEREDREDARARVYRLRRESIEGAREWLGEVEAFWGAQLDAFKAHVEAKSAPKRSK